jgi:hypothetical protein
MSRQIRLSFLGHGVSAVAELRADNAPRTCDALWAALPVVGVSHHATYSGSECVLVLPTLVQVEPEKPTADVEVGDVAFTWFAAGAAYGVTEPFAEIAWFYDVDARPSMHEGPAPMTPFARVVESDPGFYDVCRAMRREGVQGLAVEQVDTAARRRVVVYRQPGYEAHDPHVLTVGDEVRVLFTLSSVGADGPDPRRDLAMLARSADGGESWTVTEAPGGTVGQRAQGPPGPAGVLVNSSGAGWPAGLEIGAAVRCDVGPDRRLVVLDAWDAPRDASPPVAVRGIHAVLTEGADR